LPEGHSVENTRMSESRHASSRRLGATLLSLSLLWLLQSAAPRPVAAGSNPDEASPGVPGEECLRRGDPDMPEGSDPKDLSSGGIAVTPASTTVSPSARPTISMPGSWWRALLHRFARALRL
jgi:hypothetical protein